MQVPGPTVVERRPCMDDLPLGMPTADEWPDPDPGTHTTHLSPKLAAGVVVLLAYVAEQYAKCHAVSDDQPPQ